MRHAGAAAAREHAHPVARAEGLVRFLHDRDVLARIELDRDLDARTLVRAALDVGAEDAAQDGAPVAPAICPLPPPTLLPAMPPSAAPPTVPTPLSPACKRTSRTDWTTPKRTDCSPITW
jgi:hypothetical protein